MSLVTDSLERVLGRYGGHRSGPVVVAIGGLHGNEPSGVAASRRVLSRLRETGPEFLGEFIALSGNIPALKSGRRYIDEDLNRIWMPERLARATDHQDPVHNEDRQQRELLMEIKEAISRASSGVYFLDLHSTSAGGSGFSVFADTLHNRRLAEILPCPMVLGLEEHLQGTLLNYINELGFPAVGFEGGQHDAPTTVANHEMGIWQTLASVGCVTAEYVAGELQRLAPAIIPDRRLPAIVEIRYRHDIYPGEGFVMQPGFRNFDSVHRSDLLATDRLGEIRCPETGYILMPLYQTQGNDGFFLVRRVRHFWLMVSVWMRALGLARVMQYLPGVSRRDADTFVVDPRIARWLVVEIFHLLGFRRQRPEAGMQVFAQRRETPRNRPLTG